MIELMVISDKDLEWVRQLRNRNCRYFFHNEKVSPEEQKKWYKNLTGYFFVILKHGQRIGTVSVRYNETLKCNEIGNFLLDTKYRSVGIGKKVYEQLKKHFGNKFFLQVRYDNTDAVRIYKAMGFVPERVVMWNF
jgi:ribosomal protein S18 acetylase RimI-like enzyme